MNESAAEASRPAVRFYRPAEISPMVREDCDFLKNGMSVHRRVVSKPKDRSVHIDVDYDSYRAGVSIDVARAYAQDELCYIVSGEVSARSDDRELLFRAGDFIWRPAGAATQRVRVLKDTVAICAFGPARDDDWSHHLPRSQAGRLDGDRARRPRIMSRNFREVSPVARPGVPEFSDGRIVSRRIFTRQGHGVAHIDATHNFYRAGIEGSRIAYDHDQLCWVESGEIKVAADGVDRRLRAHEFIWQPVGAKIDHMKVLEDSVVICFSAPARDE